MMARPGVSARTADGDLVFLGDLPRGLVMPAFPDALCAAAGQDANLWHPSNGHRVAAEQAKAICHRCPVEQECLEWAMEAHEDEGIWGGTSPLDRKKIRQARRDRQVSSMAQGAAA